MVFSNALVVVNAPVISEKRAKRFSMHSGIHTVADLAEKKGGNNVMSIGGACSCKEIEAMLQEILSALRAPGKGDRRRQTTGERTPRQQFMSDCMRSPAKGGQGKGMAVCASEWKEKK